MPSEDVRKLFPFIPILEALAIDGASLGAAIVATALLDAVVLPEFSSFGIALAEAWMAHFPDDTVFWIDNGIGKRWCGWLKGLYAISPTTFAPDTPLRTVTDRILSEWFASGWPKPVSLKSRFAHELVHTAAHWVDLNRSSKGGRITAVAQIEPLDVGTANGRFRREGDSERRDGDGPVSTFWVVQNRVTGGCFGSTALVRGHYNCIRSMPMTRSSRR